MAAGPAASEDVPVPGGVDAFAGALGIDPTPDRGRFIFDVTRLVHENPSGRRPPVAAFVQQLALHPGRGAMDFAASDRRSVDVVPVPLTAEIWSRAVFHRKVAREELVGAIVADHIAALLCHGLATLDDQTLDWIAEHSSVLSRLSE